MATIATSAISQINNAKLYVPVVTLSFNDNIKFFENIKLGFKRTISWNKYRFEITTKLKNNNLDYLTDPTIRSINRLYVISFKNDNDDAARDSFVKFYMPLLEIKAFNASIDNKPFLDQQLENRQDASAKPIKIIITQQETH